MNPGSRPGSLWVLEVGPGLGPSLFYYWSEWLPIIVLYGMGAEPRTATGMDVLSAWATFDFWPPGVFWEICEHKDVCFLCLPTMECFSAHYNNIVTKKEDSVFHCLSWAGNATDCTFLFSAQAATIAISKLLEPQQGISLFHAVLAEQLALGVFWCMSLFICFCCFLWCHYVIKRVSPPVARMCLAAGDRRPLVYTA